MKKLSGFSLMEMMIVLLIVSIVAAASAPMINKKLVGVATDKSPWVWVGNSNSIAYNLLGSDTQTVTIGATEPSESKRPRLFIRARDGFTTPHITLQNNNDASLKFLWAKNTIGLTTKNYSANNDLGSNSVVIGSSTNVTNCANSTVIGHSANIISSANTTVIGANTYSQGFSNSVVIGANSRTGTGGADATVVGANAYGYYYSVAMGASANSQGSSVSLGAYSNARGDNSIAIGRAANTNGDYAIAIGRNSNARAAVGSIAIGSTANTYNGGNSIAIGNYARAMMSRSVAIGENAYVNEGNSSGVQARAIAIGYNAVASHSDAIAIGGKYGVNPTRATNTGATAIGSSVQAKGQFSIAIGGTSNMTQNAESGAASSTYASATNSIAIGTEATATGTNSLALGAGAVASNTNSTAIGYKAQAVGANYLVLGNNNTTVYIPGRLIIGNTTDYDNPNNSDWLLHVRGLSYLGPKAKKEKQIYTGSRDGWGHFYRSSESGNDDVKISNSGCDRRLKNVGEKFKGGLAELKKLSLYHFTYKKDESKIPHVGVMAQDLQKVFPNAVSVREDGFLQIRFEDMFYALINAVKEIDVRVTKLEKENLELKKQNQVLMKRLTELEKKLK